MPVVELTTHQPSAALVLGSGGARGLAHIGVIEALQREGFRIAGIAGSSMGALVGGIHAAGSLSNYRDWICALQRSDVLRLLDFGFGVPGLIRGERIIGVLRELVGEHAIENLPIPFTAVATDLHAQREVWLNRGPLFDAIRASIAIPGVFTPHRLNGRDLVDGGLLAPVPIAATRQMHADVVVAVEVNAINPHRPWMQGDKVIAKPVPTPAGEGYRARVSAFIESITAGFAERRDTPAVPPSPGLVDLMARSLDTMQAQLGRMQLAMDPPDIVIRVPRDSAMFYEFWRAPELIDIGREAATEALADWRSQRSL
ncbi:MAG: NTE family protein RssA [Alphaproteobacteria bacterium ADurb.BinA280]|nr:patatin-like phospholipase family protein [Xanthomonadales bacterium]OPZ13011.1 MAG: NTE family protein RssA [Alphaproteobacteria bacterium ADurb.BinA280]